MIGKEAFEKLISDKAPEVQAKAVVLYNGMVQGANAYQKDSTAANLRNWRVAEKELDEFLASLGDGATQERTFKNISAVVKYLHSKGWKISDRTGYNHRNKGLIRPRKDGKYYVSDVDNYARSGELQRLDGVPSESSDQDIERKRKADADRAEYEARIYKKKAEEIEGRYIERYAFERALAQRAATLKNDIEAFIRGKAEEMVSVAGGDPGRVPDIMEFLLDEFEKCLGRYAEDRTYKVPPTYIFENKEDTIDAD